MSMMGRSSRGSFFVTYGLLPTCYLRVAYADTVKTFHSNSQ